MKRRIAFLAVFVVALACLSASVTATADNIRVIPDISPFAVENNIKYSLNTFNEINEGWDIDSRTDINGNVTLAEKIDTFPYRVLTGNGCLIYRNKAAESGKTNYISKKYAEPLDLSAYSHIFLAVNCSEADNASYKLNIELKSGWRSFEAESAMAPAGWSGVFVDISSFEYRDSIDTFRISVGYESADAPVSFFEYYIDSIMLTDNINIVNTFLYSSDGYNLSDGTNVVSNGEMVVFPQADGVTVDSVGFSYKSLGDANCLKVEFGTEGICMGVKLYTYDSTGNLRDETESKVDNNGHLYTAYLPVVNKDISSIRLTFDTFGKETLTVYCIEPYSVYVSDSGNTGNIDTCAINSNTEEIIVKGSGVDEFLQKEIYLFANDMCDDLTSEILSRQQSIAKSVITSGDFIFRVNYSDADDMRAYLYKKYTVAVKTEDGYKIVGGSKCITNPESFNKEASVSDKKGSGKGVYGQSIAFMQEMGVSDTAIWVDISRFFEGESDSENKFECGGNLYYYNYEYVKTLDSMIKNYSEKGIRITLVAVVSDSGNSELNRILIHSDADKEAQYCAYNTSDRSGLMYLRAFSEYLAREYCENGNVSRIVFGDGVGFSSSNYNMGSKTLDFFTAEYAKGLRMVYNAVKSYSPNTEIYTYIDDNWDRDLPFDLYTRYDNRTFIDSLCRRINDYGDINWGIAQNPYPYRTDDYFSYSDNKLNNSVDSDRVSFKNINVIDVYLNGEGVMYNNTPRDFIIIEKTFFSDIDEQAVTADYVYSCYKALNTAASAYITDRSCNYNNAMKYVDTSLSLMASHFVPDVLGVSTWESVIEGFSEENIIKTEITQSKTAFSAPEYKGSSVISDFSSGEHGWKRYGFTEKITTGMTLLDKSNLMSLTLGKIPIGEKKGIVKEYAQPLDLTATPILHFDINIASLPTGVNSAELAIILVSENKVFEVTGTIKETVWTEIYCDFSGFEGLDEVEEIRILISSGDTEFESPQALITSIEGLSVEYDDSELEEILNPVDSEMQQWEAVRKYAVPVLIVISLLALAAFIARRIKRR